MMVFDNKESAENQQRAQCLLLKCIDHASIVMTWNQNQQQT